MSYRFSYLFFPGSSKHVEMCKFCSQYSFPTGFLSFQHFLFSKPFSLSFLFLLFIPFPLFNSFFLSLSFPITLSPCFSAVLFLTFPFTPDFTVLKNLDPNFSYRTASCNNSSLQLHQNILEPGKRSLNKECEEPK